MKHVVQIPNLPAAISLSGSEQMEIVQAGVSVRATVSQVVAGASAPPAATTLPIMDGAATPGTQQTYSRGDHVHPTDTTRYAASNPSGYQTAAQVTATLVPYALIDSQAFSGTPSMPTGAVGVTQPAADNSTKLATTAFVKSVAGAVFGRAIISDTPPPAPSPGSIWWESDTGIPYIYYPDVNSSQWVLFAPTLGGGGGGSGGGGGTPSDTVPLSDGVGAPGVSSLYARGDHVHPAMTPTITVSTTAPSSPAVGDIWVDIS